MSTHTLCRPPRHATSLQVLFCYLRKYFSSTFQLFCKYVFAICAEGVSVSCDRICWSIFGGKGGYRKRESLQVLFRYLRGGVASLQEICI